MEQIERLLAEHPFFKGLESQYITTIAGNSRRVNYNPGEFLMREDSQGNCFFLILHGIVAVEVHMPDRGSIIVSTKGENDVLGYCWLIPPYSCRFDVRAVELTRTICIDGLKLRRMCEENHQVGFELMKRTSQMMSKLIEATRMQLLDVHRDHS